MSNKKALDGLYLKQGEWQMSSSAKNCLHYIQKSIADAARLTPSLDGGSVVEITVDEIESGILGDYARGGLQNLAKLLAKSLGKRGGQDEEVWPINVVVVPRIFALRPEHGEADKTYPKVIAPLLLQAKLGRDGRLVPDTTLSTPAILPRELLEPNRKSVSIGRVEDADKAYAIKQEPPSSWADLMRNGIALLEAVSGTTFEEFQIGRYERKNTGLALVAGNAPATFAILRLLDLLQSNDECDVPLLESLIQEAQDQPLLTMAQQVSTSARHLGQMECRYPLSVSQRESLMHHLSTEVESNILAVDGPPGTGKTTLLLSAIATLWVERALEEADPPLIVATSTNNQAVTNILRAFSEVKEQDGPLSGRWLDGVDGYGIYLPAISRGDKFDFPVHEMRGMGKDAVFDAQKFETKVALNDARNAFLGRLKGAFEIAETINLAKGVSVLHSKIKEQATLVGKTVEVLENLLISVGRDDVSTATLSEFRAALEQEERDRASEAEHARSIREEAKRLSTEWAKHQSDEPWWVELLARFGARGKREKRDHLFCSEVAITHASIIDENFVGLSKRQEIDRQIKMLSEQAKQDEAQALARASDAGKRLSGLVVSIEFLRALVGEQDMTPGNVQGALDLGPRYTAFKLATHYWEARYLQNVEGHFCRSDVILDSKSPKRLIAQYQRIAMLHPCFVATLFTLPSKFIAWPSPTESVALAYTIDLLIVDEAGQVSPEVGAPCFALAKRALVVGDVDQIEPIWQVPPHIDGANALSSGVVGDEAGLEAFRESGISAANGSLMRWAQRATPFAKFPERGRGMFLSEHRRCWPEIIDMCNALVYGGRLQPRREDDGKRAVVPSVGFIHIPGAERRRGTSRDNPTEAAAIAKWLAERKDTIIAAYPGNTLGKLVAVVTPFAAQSRQVSSALSTELGRHHGITVGTVHALQGAERRIVIFSPTYGLGAQPGTTFMDRNRSILNVAISRAQDAFMVFGNMHLFQPNGSHPCAVVGQMLFGRGSEITGVPAQLLVPSSDLPPGRLITTLEGHRDVLREAMASAQRSLIIVSPFLTESAIDMDRIEAGLSAAAKRGVIVRVVSDEQLNKDKVAFRRCVDRLNTTGATVRLSVKQGVHSKMLLVDRSWLVVGSFNWLSAVRDPSSAWARHESSMRYDGNEAFEMISGSLREIQNLVSPNS